VHNVNTPTGLVAAIEHLASDKNRRIELGQGGTSTYSGISVMKL